MNPLTQEWIDKAEADFSTAERELRARKRLNYDSVCFHAQQCVEKYLKARLHVAGVPFIKTHNLLELLNTLLPLEPLWEAWRLVLRQLNNYAVGARYPGFSADREIAKQAFAVCKDVRQTVRKSLGLRTRK